MISNSKLRKKITVIGSGVIGSSIGWHLGRLGHEVTVCDSELNKPIDRTASLNGTKASLGVLMGHLSRRRSGRSWRLRQRSMELWQQWIDVLNTPEERLELKTPLVQIARSEAEGLAMNQLLKKQKNLNLEPLATESTINQKRIWPRNIYGGLISHNDGRIDPLSLQKCLLKALDNYEIKKIPNNVSHLERTSNFQERKWYVHLANGISFQQDIIVICTAYGSNKLLEPLGHQKPISPVLGQAIELQLKKDNKDWSGWPAVLLFGGINMIPNQNNTIIIGATLEPGIKRSQKEIKQIMLEEKDAPLWLKEASIKSQWSGIRGRPSQQPAPILEYLEPGLIMASGHYRNGVLLAPATAEWVGKEIMKSTI